MGLVRFWVQSSRVEGLGAVKPLSQHLLFEGTMDQ